MWTICFEGAQWLLSGQVSYRKISWKSRRSRKQWDWSGMTTVTSGVTTVLVRQPISERLDEFKLKSWNFSRLTRTLDKALFRLIKDNIAYSRCDRKHIHILRPWTDTSNRPVVSKPSFVVKNTVESMLKLHSLGDRRLLHSPSLVAVQLSEGYETKPPFGHSTFGILLWWTITKRT